MLLPSDPNRARIRAFWLALTAPLALALGVWAVTGGGEAAVWAAALALGAAVAGAARPEAVRGVYAAWETLAELAARILRRWLLTVCFGIVWAARLGGSRVAWRPRPADRSGWMEKEAREGLYGSQSAASPVARPERSWHGALAAWAPETGNVWALALLPFVVLLERLRLRGGGSLGGDTYTLY